MIYPEDFGAVGDGVTDDTTALTAYFSASVSELGSSTPGGSYKFSQLSIPNGAAFDLGGSHLLSDGSLTVSSDITLSIGDGVRAGRLELQTPGTESNTDIVSLGADVELDKLIVVSSAQRAGGGITTAGDNVRIRHIQTKNIDRPLHLYNQGTVSQNKGTRIGFLEAENYVRAFRADFCSFHLGGMKVYGRSANAAMSPGHNGVLIAGCADWQMGDLWIADSGEHAFRVGGSPGAYAQTRGFKVGDITATNSGGCALKLNPTLLVSSGVTEKCQNFTFGDVIGIDVGDGSIGGNSELLRLTHCVDGRIGYTEARAVNQARSGQYGLLINDSVGVNIDAIAANALNAGFVNFDGTSDCDGINQFGGNVTNLRVGRILGKCHGNNAIGVSTAFSVGAVALSGLDIVGVPNYLVRWNSGTLSDKFFINGRVNGSAPAYWGAPTSSANFKTSIQW